MKNFLIFGQFLNKQEEQRFNFICTSSVSSLLKTENQTYLKTLFRYIAILLNAIALLALLISYIGVYISPARFWFLGFFGLAYPVFLIINVLFIVYWLLGRWKLAIPSLIVVLIGYQHIQNFFQISKKETDQNGIVICSYNVKHFSGTDNTVKWKENTLRIQNYLRNKNADIICLQELSSSLMKGFNPFITADSEPDPNMNSTQPGKDTGPAIFSRHPIIDKGEIVFENTENMIVYADIKIGKDTLRVYSCHLQSYQFTNDDIHSIEAISMENQEKKIRGIRVVGHKMKNAFIKRTTHALKLSESISQSPYPVIVCGDFNDSPTSFTYRTVRGKLKDAFVESGSGIGNSYLGKLPSYRIDYILHSPVFSAYNFKVDKVDYSDHYPVSCKLIKTPEQMKSPGQTK